MGILSTQKTSTSFIRSLPNTMVLPTDKVLPTRLLMINAGKVDVVHNRLADEGHRAMRGMYESLCVSFFELTVDLVHNHLVSEK